MCFSSPKVTPSPSLAAAPLVGTSAKDDQSALNAMEQQRKKQQSAFSFSDTLIAKSGLTPETQAKKLLGI